MNASENFGRYLSEMIHFSTLNFIFGLRTWNVDFFYSLTLMRWPLVSLVALANSSMLFWYMYLRCTKYIHGLFKSSEKEKPISNAARFHVVLVETQFSVTHATICVHFSPDQRQKRFFFCCPNHFPPNVSTF